MRYLTVLCAFFVISLAATVGQVMPVYAQASTVVVASGSPLPANKLAAVATDEPVARGVMFWLDGCGHCEYIRNEVLPPMQARYGPQLDILMIEIVSEEDVERLYATAALFGMQKQEVGVPFLIIGDEVLTGSEEIPARLPKLIEAHLAAGGVDYPRLSTLVGLLPPEAVDEQATGVAASPAEDQAESASKAGGQLSNGFVLAYIVLGAMLLVLVYVIVAVARSSKPAAKSSDAPAWQSYAVPVLALLGLGVSLYMSYVETQHAEAVCGPVGDCNTVQSSPYARLLGAPIGILGVLGYAAILVVWLWQRLRHDRLAAHAPLILFAMTFLGTLFSIYLTYLEPFVIRAVCMWCLSQAVIMTLLLMLSIGPVVRGRNAEVEPGSV